MTTRRATRKASARRFHVGDVVTWGHGVIAHRVVEVTALGVVVDTTSTGFGKLDGGRRTMLIEFAPGSRSHRCPGPPRHTDMAPDQRI